MDYWLVVAELKDGRRFGNVCVTGAWRLGFPDLCSFKAEDIVDVEWDGYRGGKSRGAPEPLTSS